jgi:glucose uptake protein GlcU
MGQTIAVEQMSGLTSISESKPVSVGSTLISVRLNGCIVCEMKRDKALKEVLGVVSA